ncbi:arylsulfatase A-like enzyme [Microbacteriaceae bacterium SG_E_30_P1]|uniref:Arylsulfatase A-like enzyme n=1 Tax=Antiquaquibacter oligotrophicus TaxID=2880260 RepID=A0ABT6KQ84_9MICO|nr:sulfatase-like hydrolase/transferase [Antiquaquibacter oligotrophicus]MDH6181658.1 arylsulfatase A-like enzyme [Antiquaquibacter oligotrophicus]UDF12658.1 sulfatase-like hydrolase/transferase [Antiquaquibacter oligotrophicus]
MRAVVVMFDTLNRRYLPPYGGADVLPNFDRLAARSVTFDTCYAGSMPCMPARREMHTGRYNFLHRSWGPLEPFDDSAAALLGDAGVYTHLVTDHKHYWGDGGATYHGRFRTFEFIRGQEGDAWKGVVRDPADIPGSRGGELWRQDQINRRYTESEERHPQTLTFDAGIEFIQENHREDRWFLQIEAFDPHEPFTASEQYQSGETPQHDWPSYKRTAESDPTSDYIDSYRALLRQCDHSLGRVLDEFDRLSLWDNTMLIVCTDHGLLLGEHEWWGKMVQPWYEENIHVPLFVWDPRSERRGARNTDVVRTIDFAPTLLEFFGAPVPDDMEGEPIGPLLSGTDRESNVALFGNHGGHVNVTDGRYVYMRASVSPDNQPLFEYTLMPTRLQGAFPLPELREAALVPGFDFTKGIPVLKVPTVSTGSPWLFGTMLFDLATDPDQLAPLEDDAVELRMATLLVEAMREADAPLEQYTRLGLPATGPVGEHHLLVRAQRAQRERGALAPPRAEDFDPDSPVVSGAVRSWLADPATSELVMAALPFLANPFVSVLAAPMTLIEAASLGPAVGTEEMAQLNTQLLDARELSN